MNFPPMDYLQVFEQFSDSQNVNITTWYVCDEQGDEFVQSSHNCQFPFLHKGDVYMDTYAQLPKGSFKALGYDIKPYQVLGLTSEKEYVMPYTCIQGEYTATI